MQQESQLRVNFPRSASVFGTVDVWRVPHEMRGGYGEIFRQLEERQRQLPS